MDQVWGLLLNQVRVQVRVWVWVWIWIWGLWSPPQTRPITIISKMTRLRICFHGSWCLSLISSMYESKFCNSFGKKSDLDHKKAIIWWSGFYSSYTCKSYKLFLLLTSSSLRMYLAILSLLLIENHQHNDDISLVLILFLMWIEVPSVMMQ